MTILNPAILIVQWDSNEGQGEEAAGILVEAPGVPCDSALLPDGAG